MKEKNMITLIVGRDLQTSDRAGMHGHYQIETLIDHDGKDLVDKVDQGLHFSLEDDEQIKKYLSNIFKSNVQLEFEDPLAP